MTTSKKQLEKTPAAESKQSNVRKDILLRDERPRTPKDRVLDLQRKIGNKSSTGCIISTPKLRAANGRVLHTPDTSK